MTDIIEDLKAGCDPLLDQDLDIRKCNAYLQALCQDAALEIETLRQRLHEVIVDWQITQRQIAECQAREAALRDFAIWMSGYDIWEHNKYFQEMRHILIQTDDTALKEAIKQAKREALLEAADKLANDWNCIGGFPEDRLRRMAEELK